MIKNTIFNFCENKYYFGNTITLMVTWQNDISKKSNKKHRPKSVLSLFFKSFYFFAAGFFVAVAFLVVVVFLAVVAFFAAGFFFSAKAFGS